MSVRALEQEVTIIDEPRKVWQVHIPGNYRQAMKASSENHLYAAKMASCVQIRQDTEQKRVRFVEASLVGYKFSLESGYSISSLIMKTQTILY